MRIQTGRRATLTALLALVVAMPFIGRTSVSASPPATATFNPNLLLPGSSGAGEPSIRTDRFGRSFVIGPTGAQCQAMRVSHDGSSAKFLGAPDHNAGGGDCDWAIGPQETATLPTFPTPADSDLAFSSLDNLLNITVGKSNDGGASFGAPNPAAAQVVGDDRMWNVADPKLNSRGFATVYMSYHDISTGLTNIQVSVSTDGGQTYVQSGPLINPLDVDPQQWTSVGAVGPSVGAGNELGNLVARRDSSGALTLYSIFITPDSGADNRAQGTAQTTNFNRVYEAVGTVTDPALASGVPTVIWHDYEVYHGPVGVRYNRIFPITAVDDAGGVYSFWSDGNHIDYKTDATGTGWNPAVAPGQIADPAGVNTAIMPWAQAGRSGIADLVFYGASGGSGAQPSPQDDVNNVWNVYMAQTVDGGATWGVFKASDHVIHKGPICIDGLACNLSTPARDRTILDFFQVSIDPTNGAADIAYADDHGSPGSAVLYFTRQCTGTSATTGRALSNDCKAPPPPPMEPQGTTCPGPQILDAADDAPDNFPGGTGQAMSNLEILSAAFGTTKDATGNPSELDVTLRIANLTVPPDPNFDPNLPGGAYWSVHFSYAGTAYEAQASGTANAATIRYTAGKDDGNEADAAANNTQITGAFNSGPNGTIVFKIAPLSLVGSPPAGAHLTNTFANTHGAVAPPAVLGGVYYTAAADRAPDTGSGADYVVSQVCTAGGGGGGGGGGCHEADGSGDDQGNNGGSAHFQSDEDSCEDNAPSGEQFSDPGSGQDFRSTEVQSVQFDDSIGTMTVYGLGTSSGVPVSFVIVEQATTATTPGFYSIALSDGYQNAANLLSGTISLS